MKAIIVVDVPVEDPIDIDEYDLTANIDIYPTTLTLDKKYFTKLFNVDVRQIQPQITKGEWISEEYKKGWNAFRHTIIGDEDGL